MKANDTKATTVLVVENEFFFESPNHQCSKKKSPLKTQL